MHCTRDTTVLIFSRCLRACGAHNNEWMLAKGEANGKWAISGSVHHTVSSNRMVMTTLYCKTSYELPFKIKDEVTLKTPVQLKRQVENAPRASLLNQLEILKFSLLRSIKMRILVTVRQRVSAMEKSRTRSARYALRSSPLRASCRSISANMRSMIRWVRLSWHTEHVGSQERERALSSTFVFLEKSWTSQV